MRIFEARFILSAVKLWQRRRIQALLSMLGIVAGVSGLVIVVALGEGASRELKLALGSLGAGSVIIRDTSESHEPAHLNGGIAQRIQQLAGASLTSHTQLTSRQRAVSSESHRLENVRIVATDRQYQFLYKLKLHAGRFITDYDLAGGHRICILGWEAGRTLFPRGQVLGQQIRIGDEWFKVVGWLSPATLNIPKLDALQLSDTDRMVYVPVATEPGTTRAAALDELILKFDSERNMTIALNLVRRILGTAGVGGGAESNAETGALEFIVPIQLLRQKQALQQFFQYLLLGIAALMLTVGGVGIMNMMMVNVISRRPEIGLRLAIGASRRDIINQFVTESLVIAVAGGIAGVLIGFVVSILVDWGTDWHMVYNGAAALIGFAVSVTIGVIFGSYPALQAASVSPIRSLNEL